MKASEVVLRTHVALPIAPGTEQLGVNDLPLISAPPVKPGKCNVIVSVGYNSISADKTNLIVVFVATRPRPNIFSSHPD